MLNLEIENKLSHLKHFLGVYSRDNLPEKANSPSSLVANFDKYGEPGSHWIAIFIDNCGDGEYFDPYGLPPLHIEFLNFLQRNTHNLFWNKIPLQCDMWSLLCSIYKIKNKRFKS